MDKAMTDVLKYKRKTFLFVFLAIALVLATWYKLKIQGITLTEDISYEEVLICENAEETHMHLAECYELVAVTSSDKQNEIDNTTEDQTTENNLDKNAQKEEKTNSQEILEDNQAEIPKDTEQAKIAKDINNNEMMLAELTALGQASTYALGDTSSASDKVNVYLYIDNKWQSIGYVDRGSYQSWFNTYYTVSSDNIINLIQNELGITVSTSDIRTLYYSNNQNYARTTLSDDGTYSLGTSNTHRDIYITASLNNSTRTKEQLTQGNTFKVYSVKEYNLEDVLQPIQYVYATTGTATYQLSSDYNYYVNESTNVTIGGTEIDITGPTTLKQILAEKCTVTIKYANGTQTTVQVIKGGTYTLGSYLKWKVGEANELTDGGTKITVNEDITIEEAKQITIIYTVDISTTATGLEENFLYDEISVPTVQGSSTYEVTITYADGTTIEKLSNNYVTPYNNSEDTKASKDREVLEFTAWKVNNSSTQELQPETELTWEQLYNYAKNGVINLSTKWNKASSNQKVNFYINFKSQALDIDGNITGQSADKFTPSLWATYVGNATATNNHNIADETADNSFTADKNIRALIGNKDNGTVYLYDFPSDEYILGKLKEHTSNLSIDGQPIDKNELDLEHFAIRWYVFKYHSNGFHIDGRLVRKEGKMTVTKTFAGSKAAIESVTGYSFTEQEIKNNTGYCINVKGGETDLNLYTGTNSSISPIIADNSITTYEDTTYLLTFIWVIDVKYGINYTIAEQNYNTEGYLTNTVYNIVDPESTKYKKAYNADGSYYYETDNDGNFIPTYTNQSKGATTGIMANVVGINNYAIDSKEPLDTTKILEVSFSNTYAPASAITIQKEDSITNNGLANAQFSLYVMNSNNEYDKNSPIKFTYNESIYTYNENGDRTVLTSSTGGSIIIDGLPTNQKYKLVEISVPDGYDGNSSVEVTLDATSEGVIVPAITKGAGKDYDTTNKILEIDNASKLTEVKVTKEWIKVPVNYIKDVTVDLYLNNMPISSYNLDYDLNGDGTVNENDKAQMQVVLNESNNWTYTWKNLPLYVDGSKAIYTVREVQIGEIRAVTDGRYDSMQGTWESYDAYTQYRAHTTVQQETKDTKGETKQIYFKLINEIHLVKIEINKISPLGKAIDGVEFTLQKIDEFGNIDDTFEARILVTDEAGKLSFVDLEYDTRYVLTETKGNKGYYLDSTPIYLIIKKAEQQGKEDTLVLYTDNTFAQEAVEGDYEYVSLNETKTILNVINISHTPMPKAGGMGVYSFYIVGILLMGCSTSIIYLRKNKIKKGK